jgi:hypothetical protein
VPISLNQLPDDADALKRIIAAMAQDAVNAQAEIAKLRFQLARYRRAEFGRSSEKLEREADQLELAIEALETDQAERLAAASPVVAAVSWRPYRAVTWFPQIDHDRKTEIASAEYSRPHRQSAFRPRDDAPASPCSIKGPPMLRVGERSC